MNTLIEMLSPDSGNPDFPGNITPVSGKSDKLRALYIMGKYPEFSETYMHEEIASIYDEYDLKIISYLVAENPRKKFFPYQLIQYKDACLNWGSFEHVNVDFTNQEQIIFLATMGELINEFRPDVLHAHYFATSLIIRKLSDIHKIPFTLRTHSFDMLQPYPDKISTLCNAVNTPLCIGVFTYPAFRNLFIQHGIPEDKIHVSWPVVNVNRFYNTEIPERKNRVLCCGPCTDKKAHNQFIDLADSMRHTGYEFNLYTRGNCEKKMRKYNQSKGDPVTILYSEPEDMPHVYRNHDWLVYPSDTEINQVGLPCSIIEAQASGIGICWQELPGRKQEQIDFMGGAGFLFNSIDDVPAIINNPYPEEMRITGYKNSKKCDVQLHKTLLTSVWNKTRLSQNP